MFCFIYVYAGKPFIRDDLIYLTITKREQPFRQTQGREYVW